MKRGHTAKLQKAIGGDRFGKLHGMRNTITGSSWISMVGRCFNLNHTAYPIYGGRGIFVCEFLRKSPHNLVATIGERPSLDYSIDRKNNSGSYTCGGCGQCKSEGRPLNVRWATYTQQGNNKSSNVILDLAGRKQTVSEWAEELGIKRATIFGRIKRGQSGMDLIAPAIDKNKYMVIDGKQITRAELCQKLDIGTKALGMRISRGWTPEELLLGRQKPRQVHLALK